jgi:hypothetical protein
MSKIEPNPRVNHSTHTATQILRGMVYSLLENGCTKQELAAVLDRLADEARGDNWKKALEIRERGRGLGRSVA